NAVPAGGTCQCSTNATNSFGRITDCPDHEFGLFHGFDHRNQQRLCTAIKELLDQLYATNSWYYDRLRGLSSNTLQLRQSRSQITGCMLTINQQPVITCICRNLGSIGICQSNP